MHPRRMWIFVGACLAGTACDIPTEPPILDHRWVLPLEVVTIDQSELLPTEVQIAGTNYDVTVADVAASETLAALCPLCVNGAFGATPPFQGSFSSVENLPTEGLMFDSDVSRSGTINLAEARVAIRQAIAWSEDNVPAMVQRVATEIGIP